MAYISQYKDRWRAQVEVTGFPRKSATFDTREQAEFWAAEKEAVFKRRRAAMALGERELVSRLPRPLLQAMAQINHTPSDVVAGAMPMRANCGIYFLIKHQEVVYVGQSINVLARISRHSRDGLIDFDSFNIIPCHEAELDEVEQSYILAMMPLYNTVFRAVKRSRQKQPAEDDE